MREWAVRVEREGISVKRVGRWCCVGGPSVLREWAVRIERVGS